MPQVSSSSSPDAVIDARTPLCLVCDEESSVRHFLSLLMQSTGIDAAEFSSGAALRQAIGGKPANLVFLDIPINTADAIASLEALAQGGYAGAIQIMSARSSVLERVYSSGRKLKLNMLPPLSKPFEAAAIQKIISDLKIGLPPAVAARMRLEEVLENNWLQFWLQPKIDLRKKQLAGAKAIPRARHPQFGILPPSAFMPGAKEPDLLRVAELAIAAVVQAERQISALGIGLQIAVDMEVRTLVSLPVLDILRDQGVAVGPWPGMIIDIPESQIATDIPLANELSARLSPGKVKLAIDEAGRSLPELGQIETSPFVEYKIADVFASNCTLDKANAQVCRAVVDLAHKAGATAVGNGIAKAADLATLVNLGCDHGQGALLGQPMPQERFLSLLRQRAATQRGHRAA